MFDLDDTLVDSVYQHGLAWREALEEVGMESSVWRNHRRIGMSEERETGRANSGADEGVRIAVEHTMRALPALDGGPHAGTGTEPDPPHALATGG